MSNLIDYLLFSVDADKISSNCLGQWVLTPVEIQISKTADSFDLTDERSAFHSPKEVVCCKRCWVGSICLRNCASFTFQNYHWYAFHTIAEHGMGFIPLQKWYGITLCCHSSRRGKILMISRLWRRVIIWYAFGSPSSFGNWVVYSFHSCNDMKCIPVLILKSQRHTFSQTNNFSQINKFFVTDACFTLLFSFLRPYFSFLPLFLFSPTPNMNWYCQ